MFNPFERYVYLPEDVVIPQCDAYCLQASGGQVGSLWVFQRHQVRARCRSGQLSILPQGSLEFLVGARPRDNVPLTLLERLRHLSPREVKSICFVWFHV